MEAVVVNSKELGTNCWSAHRFCGGRCPRVMRCTYPEKATCKAVQAEIDYLNNYYANVIDHAKNTLCAKLEILK